MLGLDYWALSGDWTMEEQSVTLNEAGGQVMCRFHVRDLHLVMGPASPGAPVRFRVRIDGQPPTGDHGTDTGDAGDGTAAGQRLYQLIRQSGPVIDRTFEDHFFRPGCPGLRIHLRIDAELAG